MLDLKVQLYKPNYNDMESRICLSCERELPINCFRWNGHGYNNTCKECQKKKAKNFFIAAGYEVGTESFYCQQLKKAYPNDWKIMIIKIRRQEY